MGAGEWPGREAYLAGLGLKRKYVRSLVKVAIFMVDEQIGGEGEALKSSYQERKPQKWGWGNFMGQS